MGVSTISWKLPLRAWKLYCFHYLHGICFHFHGSFHYFLGSLPYFHSAHITWMEIFMHCYEKYKKRTRLPAFVHYLVFAGKLMETSVELRGSFSSK